MHLLNMNLYTHVHVFVLYAIMTFLFQSQTFLQILLCLSVYLDSFAYFSLLPIFTL